MSLPPDSRTGCSTYNGLLTCMPADETQFLATKYVGAFPPVGYGPNLVQVIGHCDVEVCLVLKNFRSHTPSVG